MNKPDPQSDAAIRYARNKDIIAERLLQIVDDYAQNYHRDQDRDRDPTKLITAGENDYADPKIGFDPQGITGQGKSVFIFQGEKANPDWKVVAIIMHDDDFNPRISMSNSPHITEALELGGDLRGLIERAKARMMEMIAEVDTD